MGVLTFLPAWRRAKASSVEMVLFPTPPFPERTRMMCRTPARFPGSGQKKGGEQRIPFAPDALRSSLQRVTSNSHVPNSETCPFAPTEANTPRWKVFQRPAPDQTCGFPKGGCVKLPSLL